MSKPRLFKGYADDLWYCTDYLYCGEGVTPKDAYEDWVKNKEQYTHDTLTMLKMSRERHIVPFTLETVYPPPIRPWEYQDNPKEDYSDLVWYKRWWKRFADIWKGD